MRIYTRSGDDGTTSMRIGERLAKSAPRVALLGDLDESQAALGLARAECVADSSLDLLLLDLERDLWILMAEVASPPTGERPSQAGVVTTEMVQRLEGEIDAVKERLELQPNFSVPGGDRLSAALDFARTVVRRAERGAVAVGISGQVLAYLNRLSDLCWALARDVEVDHLIQRSPRRGANPTPPEAAK